LPAQARRSSCGRGKVPRFCRSSAWSAALNCATGSAGIDEGAAADHVAFSIINVTVAGIAGRLHASLDLVQWVVVSGYMLA